MSQLHVISFVKVQRKKVGVKPLIHYPKIYIQISFKIH
jgi:hypothetical protein